MTLRVRLGAPKGKRVVWMTVAGKPVGDHATYTVATRDRPGDDPDVLCRFTGATETRILPLTFAALLLIVENGNVSRRCSRRPSRNVPPGTLPPGGICGRAAHRVSGCRWRIPDCSRPGVHCEARYKDGCGHIARYYIIALNSLAGLTGQLRYAAMDWTLALAFTAMALIGMTAGLSDRGADFRASSRDGGYNSLAG